MKSVPEQDCPEQPPPFYLSLCALALQGCGSRHHVEGEGTVDQEHDDAVVEHPEHVDRVESFRDAEEREDPGRDLLGSNEGSVFICIWSGGSGRRAEWWDGTAAAVPK
jgi:hypothetical protein